MMALEYVNHFLAQMRGALGRTGQNTLFPCVAMPRHAESRVLHLGKPEQEFSFS